MQVRSPDSLTPREALEIVQQGDRTSPLFEGCCRILDGVLEIEPPIPKPTPRVEPRFLTIGMAAQGDARGPTSCIQAIRLYHPEILGDVEFLVVDENPAAPGAWDLKGLERLVPNYRYVPWRLGRGAAVRDLIFREASGEFVLCVVATQSSILPDEDRTFDD